MLWVWRKGAFMALQDKKVKDRVQIKSMSPQGSAVALLLFSILTDDPEKELYNQMFRSADSAEVFQAVKCVSDDEKPHKKTSQNRSTEKCHDVSKRDVMQPKSCLQDY